MRKIFFAAIMAFATLTANAQLMRTEELETYAKDKYGDKWTETAGNLAATLSLDKNNSLTYTEVIPCEGATKSQLYVILNYWFTASFNDANSVIKLNDKETGTIIASGCISDVAGHVGGSNSYRVDVHPLIKVDIKDGKIRVTYTVQAYDVKKIAGGGILGAVASGLGGGPMNTKETLETWTLDKCFPFAEKDKHKKISSKALIMTHAFSNVMMDKIKEAVQNGLSGNEKEDW